MTSELMQAPAHVLLPTFGAETTAGSASSQQFSQGTSHSKSSRRESPTGVATTTRQQDPLKTAVSSATPQFSSTKEGADNAEYPELTCQGAGANEWLEVKKITAQEFGSWRAGSEILEKRGLQVVLDTAVEQVANSQPHECGMGRLSMSMLTLITSSSAGSILSAQSIHQPLLTVLIEVPWRKVLESGWPLFAMLAQLHLRAKQADTAPQGGAGERYFHALVAGLERREASRLATLGADFLRSEEGRAHASTHILSGLCALASQLLSPEVGTSGMPTDAALKQVQNFFRQAVVSVEDVQGTIDTAWPLYGVLHLAGLTLQLD